jgi:hypothetical protein
MLNMNPDEHTIETGELSDQYMRQAAQWNEEITGRQDFQDGSRSHPEARTFDPAAKTATFSTEANPSASIVSQDFV